jgi:hypothetical protein
MAFRRLCRRLRAAALTQEWRAMCSLAEGPPQMCARLFRHKLGDVYQRTLHRKKTLQKILPQLVQTKDCFSAHAALQDVVLH